MVQQRRNPSLLPGYLSAVPRCPGSVILGPCVCRSSPSQSTSPQIHGPRSQVYCAAAASSTVMSSSSDRSKALANMPGYRSTMITAQPDTLCSGLHC
jgi:hypothetical protein